jgi:hypothetical protein
MRFLRATSTNRKPALGSGWSSVLRESTIDVPGDGLLPPQAPAASNMLRPTIPQPSPRCSTRSTPSPRRAASVS